MTTVYNTVESVNRRVNKVCLGPTWHTARCCVGTGINLALTNDIYERVIASVKGHVRVTISNAVWYAPGDL